MGIQLLLNPKPKKDKRLLEKHWLEKVLASRSCEVKTLIKPMENNFSRSRKTHSKYLIKTKVKWREFGPKSENGLQKH